MLEDTSAGQGLREDNANLSGPPPPAVKGLGKIMFLTGIIHESGGAGL
jgi:hypothetical protein